MNKNQEIKMQLLKSFGICDNKKTVDFCREAYKFIMENETSTPTPLPLCPVSVEPVAVDLGLPSGTLWCDRNVGANSPYDYGAFFSWGNIDPHYPNKEHMDWGDDDEAFDHRFNSDTYDNTEGAKLEGDIDLAHDAARVNMGEPWQMPTADQYQELFDNCIWERKTTNNVNGYLVTSKINGISIFFACSGHGNGTTWYNRGSDGHYWSASFYSSRNARYLYFNSGGVNPQSNGNRYYGFAVRAVQNIVK